jgi:signal transduction histidine kinase
MVDAPERAMIKGNRELLSQALANLVDNAIKYARPAQNGEAVAQKTEAAAQMPPPEIVLAVRQEGERVLLSVADRGPGIAEADRNRAVERFVRLDQSASEPGSGLGLSLAAAVARLHGGELTLEDNAPGLKVVISLPRAAG